IAQEYIDSVKYYWNRGMIMFTAIEYLEALENLHTEIYRVCEKTYQKSQQVLDFVRVDIQSFTQVQSQSIDYAVMEKASNVALVPMQ
ncbi:sugar phosphate nucleotidyltransferase, partial [Francisella tularensis]|uniref:sugar phosphate nucleotidyltransferase n=1 Tax=Francisella tularensis TaxID=263 RepID=UPI00238196E6